MSLYTISDLHIWGPEDPLYASLLVLIQERAKSGDTLILAGDIFDFLVGNKPLFAKRYAKFFSAIEDATHRGVKIHYIEGNHDFLLQNTFKKNLGVQVHPHHVSLQIEDKKFYFAHGDTVDEKDYGYRLLRAFFRSLFMRIFIKFATGSLLDQIGKKSSYQSSKGKPRVTSELPLKKMEFLRKVYRSHAAEQLAEGHDFVVMGHCHDLDEMTFSINDRIGQYINVGFPRAHGSFLSWSPGDSKIQREKIPS